MGQTAQHLVCIVLGLELGGVSGVQVVDVRQDVGSESIELVNDILLGGTDAAARVIENGIR